MPVIAISAVCFKPRIASFSFYWLIFDFLDLRSSFNADHGDLFLIFGDYGHFLTLTMVT